MGLKKDQVNITFAMSKEEGDKLQELMDYFSEESVSKVNRADVLRYLINRYHFLIGTGKMEEVFKAVESVIGEADNDQREAN